MSQQTEVAFLDEQFHHEEAGECEHCGDLIVQSEQRDHIIDVCEYVPQEIKERIERLKL